MQQKLRQKPIQVTLRAKHLKLTKFSGMSFEANKRPLYLKVRDTVPKLLRRGVVKLVFRVRRHKKGLLSTLKLTPKSFAKLSLQVGHAFYYVFPKTRYVLHKRPRKRVLKRRLYSFRFHRQGR